jgi:hypothetical protein
VEAIGSLEMRDNILASFTVHDSKVEKVDTRKAVTPIFSYNVLPKDDKYVIIKRKAS